MLPRILVVDDNESIREGFVKVLSPTPASHEDRFDDLERELFGADERAAPSRAAAGRRRSTLFPAVGEVAPATYDIEVASNGAQALDKVVAARRAGRPHALAFIDIRMPPGWNGVETATRIWEVAPDMQLVICTAYSDFRWDEVIRALGRSEGLHLLRKPFEAAQVRSIAQVLTRKWSLRARK